MTLLKGFFTLSLSCSLHGKGCSFFVPQMSNQVSDRLLTHYFVPYIVKFSTKWNRAVFLQRYFKCDVKLDESGVLTRNFSMSIRFLSSRQSIPSGNPGDASILMTSFFDSRAMSVSQRRIFAFCLTISTFVAEASRPFSSAVVARVRIISL